jgi:hypothetical protein
MIIPMLLIGSGAKLLYDLYKIGEMLSVNLADVRLPGTENNALRLDATITLDNFADKAITINQPLIKVFLKNSDGSETEIANSKPDATKFKLQKRSRKAIDVNLLIPFSNIPFIIPFLLNKKSSGRTILLRVFTAGDGIPVSFEKPFEL